MARDGSGNMALLAGNPIPYGTRPASSALQNSTLADMANEISDSLSRSGKGAMLANLNMGAFSLTNLASIVGNTIVTGTLTLQAAPVLSALTANRALVADASNNLAVSVTTLAELAHLSGVTSGVQAQINAKLDSGVAAGTYLSQANAAATYQTIAGMSAYLTTAAASATYLTQANAASTYLSQANAASTYQTIAGMSSYQTTAGMSSYLTTAAAASTYAALAGAAFTGSISVSGNVTLTGTLTPQGGAAIGKITSSSSAPSGGNNDDLWFQY